MCRNITLKRYEIEFLKKWENEKEILKTTEENRMIIYKVCNFNIVDVDESFLDEGYIVFYVKIYRFYFKILVKKDDKYVIDPFINNNNIKDYFIERVYPYKKVTWYSKENYVSESERKSDLSTYMEVFGDDGDEPKIQNIFTQQQFWNDNEKEMILSGSERDVNNEK